MKIPLLASLAGLLGLFLFRQQNGAVKVSVDSVKETVDSVKGAVDRTVKKVSDIIPVKDTIDSGSESESESESDESVSDHDLEFSDDEDLE